MSGVLASILHTRQCFFPPANIHVRIRQLMYACQTRQPSLSFCVCLCACVLRVYMRCSSRGQCVLLYSLIPPLVLIGQRWHDQHRLYRSLNLCYTSGIDIRLVICRRRRHDTIIPSHIPYQQYPLYLTYPTNDTDDVYAGMHCAYYLFLFPDIFRLMCLAEDRRLDVDVKGMGIAGFIFLRIALKFWSSRVFFWVFCEMLGDSEDHCSLVYHVLKSLV
ncbi:hypothetical protein BD289DRAFT_22302 [Coniella lustricola]|uniref:Uncharacterized protein n=1 Tax=Coniella lustricola TaxID=2025994 RepID=A0A2T3A3J1_9PEZI|nr:hypothetical protein BD289DRAFT_22302 [Coniella lustricola]